MFFHVDPTSGLPIYRQIVDQVKMAIAAGDVRAGYRLPSIRQVSAALTVNPATVQKAWQELVGQGVAEFRRGLGVFITLEAGRSEKAEARRRLEETAEKLATEGIALGLPIGDLVGLLRERHRALTNGG